MNGPQHQQLRRTCAAVLLLVSTGAAAKELDFNYIEVDYIVVDLDKSETASIGAETLALETDDDAGYRAAFAWEFLGNFYLFGEYAKAENEFDATLTIGGDAVIGASGDFDVVRARGGVGYGWPLNERWSMYSRITWDYIELDDVEINGVDVGDEDDDGVGMEAGLRWLALPSLELQGYGRFTEDGELDIEDGWDEDFLGGVIARWYAHESLALQIGAEFGDITTFGGGMRFDF